MFLFLHVRTHARAALQLFHVACVQNYCKPSEMQNRGKLVFDFGIPEAPRDLSFCHTSRIVYRAQRDTTRLCRQGKAGGTVEHWGRMVPPYSCVMGVLLY